MPTRGVVWAFDGVVGQGLAGLCSKATNGLCGADRAQDCPKCYFSWAQKTALQLSPEGRSVFLLSIVGIHTVWDSDK